jgi:5-methylcytosine-specific restriction endonuclease McrA
MSTLPAWARRLLTKELRFVAEGMEFDREAAQKILALLAPRKKNEKQKATQKRKLQGAAARRAASGVLRQAVFDRAAGLCEFCGVVANHSCAPRHLHHLEGGSGRRTQKQAIENCVALCVLCHRAYHRRPADYLLLVKQWAERHGYPLPSIIRKAEASAQLPGRAAR